MNRLTVFLILVTAPFAAQAEQQSLGSTMDVYVFPAEGQAADQQNKDEAECYSWAVENTSTDPFELAIRAGLGSDERDVVADAHVVAGPRGAGDDDEEQE